MKSFLICNRLSLDKKELERCDSNDKSFSFCLLENKLNFVISAASSNFIIDKMVFGVIAYVNKNFLYVIC